MDMNSESSDGGYTVRSESFSSISEYSDEDVKKGPYDHYAGYGKGHSLD